MEERLIFLIGAPRSGSTLTARMLGAHSAIFAPQEPHLMPPLAHLGYHARVDRAPYDPVITQQGLREFVKALPDGEADYLAALRACTDQLYGRALQASGRERFLDKTPAYALVLDFLARLYPNARYIVLTRHPLAVWCSVVSSFYDGDHEVAHAHNPILERYVPAVARFLREKPAPLVHLRYEQLVEQPERELARVCDLLEIPFEPGMVNYGEQGSTPRTAQGLGDPITVARESRPTTDYVDRWTRELAGDPAKLAQAERILEQLLDEDLETWGYPRARIQSDLDAARASDARRVRTRLSRYSLQRKLLVRLRRNIHHNAFGRLVKRVRTVCDVLLR